MIIFGFKVIWRTISKGRFVCPTERVEQDYAVQEGRRFFVLWFFLPVFPLNKIGQAVRCGGCKQRFATSVLDVGAAGGAATVGLSAPTEPVDPAQKAQAALDLAVTKVGDAYRAAGVAMADATAGGGAALKQAAVSFISKHNPNYDLAMMDQDLRLLPVSQLRSIVEPAKAALDSTQSNDFIRGLIGIASAETPTPLTPSQRRVVEAAVSALGIDPDSVPELKRG